MSWHTADSHITAQQFQSRNIFLVSLFTHNFINNCTHMCFPFGTHACHCRHVNDKLRNFTETTTTRYQSVCVCVCVNNVTYGRLNHVRSECVRWFELNDSRPRRTPRNRICQLINNDNLFDSSALTLTNVHRTMRQMAGEQTFIVSEQFHNVSASAFDHIHRKSAEMHCNLIYTFYFIRSA